MSEKSTAETTQFGFVWGPIEVVRMFEDKRGRMLGLRAPPSNYVNGKWKLEIWISPTGKSIRVFRRGKELK